MKKTSIFYDAKELNKGLLDRQKNDLKVRKTTLKYAEPGRKRTEKNIKNPKNNKKKNRKLREKLIK